MEEKRDIEPVLIALRAEKKAIEYYSRAARRITNPTGKEALKKLKTQEEKHFKSLKNKFKKLAGREPRAGEIEALGTAISAMTEEHLADREASDLEVCQVALKDEKDAHDFYLRSARSAPDDEARKLYEDLAKDEKSHAETIRGLCRILTKS